jgi:phosphatidylinositol alpha-1,6-mannosyltransferase
VRLVRVLIVPGNDWVFGPKQYLHDIAEIMGKENEVSVWHFNLFRGRKPCMQEVRNVKLIHPYSIYSSNLLIYYCINFIPHTISFARTVRKLGIDAIIVANLIPGLWAFLLAPRRTLKVFGFQDYFPESASMYYQNLPKTLRRLFESLALSINKLCLRLADLSLCPCFSLLNLAEKMGCKRNYFLPNGADTDFFNPKKSDVGLREQLDLTEHTLVFYGLIENWIDFNTVLAGFQVLKKEIPDAKLLVIGSTLTNYTPVLKKMLQETNLERDVVLTGYVPNELIPDYLNLGKICLLPYKTDMFSGKIRLPLKLFMYSAMGKIILSVPLPELKRLKPSHVFYYENEREFAQKASKILNDTRLQIEQARCARIFACHFDYSKLAKRCESILEEGLRDKIVRSRSVFQAKNIAE